MVDITKLEEGLSELRGLDFEAAENQTRLSSNTNLVVPVISMTHEFQARLAAIALKVPYQDISTLPLKKYRRVCQAVQNFLNNISDDETLAENSEV